jgi:hypothetical protein
MQLRYIFLHLFVQSDSWASHCFQPKATCWCSKVQCCFFKNHHNYSIFDRVLTHQYKLSPNDDVSHDIRTSPLMSRCWYWYCRMAWMMTDVVGLEDGRRIAEWASERERERDWMKTNENDVNERLPAYNSTAVLCDFNSLTVKSHAACSSRLSDTVHRSRRHSPAIRHPSSSNSTLPWWGSSRR